MPMSVLPPGSLASSCADRYTVPSALEVLGPPTPGTLAPGSRAMLARNASHIAVGSNSLRQDMS